jgi:T1SS-143 domain-containing protein
MRIKLNANVLEEGMSLATGDHSEGNKGPGSNNTSDEASGVAGSLTGLFNAGADAPLTISLSPNTSSLPQLLSHGQPVVYEVVGNTLFAKVGADVIFRLVVNSDGSWTFDLQDQLDHVAGNGENFDLQVVGGSSVPNIDFSKMIVGTDADGDSIQISNAGKFVIAVQDDVPVANINAAPITASVEEDGMSLATGDSSEGNKEVGDTNADDEASGAAGTLTSLFSAGADENLTISLNPNTSGLPQLLSHGNPVTYAVVGNVLTATAGGIDVFTLTINPDGSYSFDLKDQLDHVAGNGENYDLKLVGGGSVSSIDFSSVIQATDADGDTVGLNQAGKFTVAVQDDVPVPSVNAAPITASVEEDGMSLATGDSSEGNKEVGDTNADDEASGAAGTLTSLFSAGADENLTISLNPNTSGLPQLLSHGNPVTYAVIGNVLTATAGGIDVFTLTINPDGSYSFDLKDQLDHVAGNGENYDLKLVGGGSVSAIDFSSVIQATDADGDTVGLNQAGKFTVAVQDDVPVPNVNAAPITASVEEDGMSLATGDSSEGNKEVGDTNADDEASGAAGTLTSLFSAGADENLTISLNPNASGLPQLLSHGNPVTYAVVGNVLTATAGGIDVFTLTINPDGSYSFDLKDQLDHVAGNGENYDLKLVGGGSVSAIDFSSVIQATDADGDTVGLNQAGKFTVAVQDDVPVPNVNAAPITASVEEDGMSLATGDSSEGNKEVGDTNADDEASGAAGTLTSLFSAGADENLTISLNPNTSGLPQLLSHGNPVTYAVVGNVLTATAGGITIFTLTVNANGSYSFDLKDQLDHVAGNGENFDLKLVGGGSVSSIDFSSVIQATDADGDTVGLNQAGKFTVAVQDDVPVPNVNAAPITASVEEDGMSLATGDSSEGNKEVGDTNADDEASGAAGALTSLFSAGADENLTISLNPNTSGLPQLLSHGNPVTYAVVGNVLTATAGGITIFTLTVNANGSYSFDLKDQLDHVAGNGENFDLKLVGGGSVSSIDFSSVIQATDADGDTAGLNQAGKFTVAVQDDVPIPNVNAAPITASVEEDGMSLATGDSSEGNKEVGDTNTDDEASGAAGTLTSLFSAGADENLTISLNPNTSGLPQLLSHGNPVTYAVVGNVLTATAGGITIFTLTVNANGSYSFDLKDQLDHVAGNGENYDLKLVGGGSVSAIDFSSVIQATDADGDTVGLNQAGKFTVAIQDDVPVVNTNAAPIINTVEEDGMSLATGDSSEGNKEVGDTNADDEVSGTIVGNGGLSSLFTVGADESITISLNPSAAGLPRLLSHGIELTYSVVGNVLTATAGANVVFTFTLNANNTWTFDLKDQLDHVAGSGENFDLRTVGGGSVSGIDLGSMIQGTDSDGDTVNAGNAGKFVIKVQDDVPIAKTNAEVICVAVEEDGMSLGTGDNSEGNKQAGDTNADDETSGTIVGAGGLSTLFSVGADEAITISLATNVSGMPRLLSHGIELTYSVVGNVLTATAGANVVFTFTLNANNTWTFDLKDQLDHVAGNGENYGLRLAGGGSIDHVDLTSILVGTDSDGDSLQLGSTGKFIVQVQDDVPVANINAAPITASVEEDGMSLATGDSSEGNKEVGDTNADDEASGAAGTLTSLFSAGADENLTISLNPNTSGLPQLLSHGNPVTYAVVGNVLTATAGGITIFTLTVNANGSYSFDLKDQLDHVAGNGENYDLKLVGGGSVSAIDFSSVIQATDADGDTVGLNQAGKFTVAIQDDVPVVNTNAAPIINTVEEDGMSLATGDSSEGNKEVGDTNADDEVSGTIVGNGGLSSLFTVGADESITISLNPSTAGLPRLLSHGIELTYSVVGNVLTATAGANVVFTFTLNANNTWTFDLKDQLDHVAGSGENFDLRTVGGGSVSGIDLGSMIQGTDADGDTVNAGNAGKFVIKVQDDVPIAKTNAEVICVAVEEDGMSLGTGDNSEGNKQAGDTNADDETSGTIVGAGGLSTLFSVGADEAITISLATNVSGMPRLLSHGIELTYSVVGNVLTATAGANVVFTFTLNANNTWTFDLKDQLDHVAGNGENYGLRLAGGGSIDHVDLTSILVGTDSDGDSLQLGSTGKFIVQVQDDVPVANINAAPITASVEEDGMSLSTGDSSEGNKEVGDTNADDEASGAAGTLTSLFSAGADENLTISLNPNTSGLPQLLSHGNPVTYAVVGNVLTATAGGITIFTLTVNANGSYSFDLKDQLDHVAGNGENYDLKLVGGGSVSAIDFSSVIQATDADGDTVGLNQAGKFTVAIQDDVPVVNTNAAPIINTVEEDGMSLSTGDSSEGNKEVGDTNADDEVSGTIVGNGGLSSLFTVGADESITISLNPSAAGLPRLLSHGIELTYSVVGNVLTATAGANVVFTFTLNANNTWTFDLKDQLDHVAGNGENFDLRTVGGGSVSGIDLGSMIQGTDSDGDTVNAGNAGKFVIKVQDDVPIAKTNAEVICVAVEEDGMSLGTGDNSEGNKQAGDTNADDETSGTIVGAGGLSTLFSVGADEAITISLATNVSGMPRLLSHGIELTYSVVGNVLTATAGANVVFTFTLNANNTWTFDLKDQLDHVAGNGENYGLRLAGGGSIDHVDLTSILVGTDSDGDSLQLGSTGKFIVQVQDDVPVANINAAPITASVEEDGMSLSTGDSSEGNKEVGDTNADDEVSGTIVGNGGLSSLFTVGADESITISLNPSAAGLPRLLSHGIELTYSVVGNVLTATAGANVVFTFTLNANNTWTFDLKDQLDHVAGSGENFDLRTVGGGSVSGIDLGSMIQGTDADGDTVNAGNAGKFVIKVQDDVPIAKTNAEVICVAVEEDGMSLGTGDNSEGNKQAGDTNADDETSGTIVGAGGLSTLFSVGADEAITISLATNVSGMPRLLSHGIELTYSVVGNVLTATAGANVVFTFTLNANNTWTFDLKDQLDHVAGNGENYGLRLAGGGSIDHVDLTSILVGTDSDGDSLQLGSTGKFIVQVQDDVLVANINAAPITASVEEDGMSLSTGDSSEGNKEVGDTNSDDEVSGTIVGNGGLSSLFTVGADESITISLNPSAAGLPRLLSHGIELTYSVVGNVLTATAGANVVFTFTLNANNTWTFDLKDQLDHVAGNGENFDLRTVGGGSVSGIDLGSMIQGTDADGDTVNAGNAGKFVIKVQDDVPIAKTNAEVICVAVEEDGMSLGTGDNSEGNKQAGDTNADDETSGTIVGAGGLSTLFSVGADEAITISLATNVSGMPRLLSHGIELTYSVVGNVLTATAGANVVFTFTLNANNTWTFDLKDQLDHVAGNGENYGLRLAGGGSIDHVDLTPFLVGTDSDGDSLQLGSTGKFIVQVQDDVPTITLNNVAIPTLTVDETNLAINASASFAGLFNVVSGADDVISLSYNLGVASSGANSGLVDTATNQNILLYLESGNIVGRVGSSAGAISFTVNVDTNGIVTLDQQRAIKHAITTNPDDSTNISNSNLITLSALATDFDGDTATQSVNIADKLIFKDDGPDAVNDNGGTIAEKTTTTGNVLTNDVFGADGAGTPKIISVKDLGTNTTYTDTDNDGDIEINLSNGGKITILTGDGSYSFIAPNIPGTNGSSKDFRFDYTIKDGDGDTDTATLSFTVKDNLFKVGTNISDNNGSSTTYAYGPGSSVISGDIGNDILVGDVGGSTVSNKSLNLILVLDVSGSMTTQIPFGNSTITRLQALKNSVSSLLNDLSTQNAQNVKVNIISFSSGATNLGTFTLTTNGVDSTTQLNNALNVVSGLTANGFTNYEAALMLANSYADSANPLPSNTPNLSNQVIFISDGAPTAYVDANGNNVTNQSSSTSMNQVLGVTDSTNDVNQILFNANSNGATKLWTIDAIGINVDNTALSLLSQVEGTGGSATNVTSAEQLQQVLNDLNPIVSLASTGSDVIQGGAGNDLIFGDVLNTDQLAIAEGINLPKGSGWDVFDALLHRPVSPWSAQQVEDYIVNHADEVGSETLSSNGTRRIGGNDTLSGGDGNDIIYGQEGTDIIDGGVGNDRIIGGSGNDVMTGGSGNDTFVWHSGDQGATSQPAVDSITDFNRSQDILDLSDLLVGETPANLGNYLSFTLSSGNTVMNIDPTGASGGSNATQQVVFQGVDMVTGNSEAQIIASLNIVTG